MAVYFTSDLHLKAERPDLTRAFLCFLQQIRQDAETLYLLGDIFEAWIGDDMPVPDLDPLFDQLKSLSESGCKIYFQQGNRDFLVGEGLMQRIGAELLPEQIVTELPCGTALLLHGDQLCIDDHEYMQFRSMVRNPTWQQDFLSKSLPERIAIAQQMRAASKQRGQEKSDYIMDVNQTAVETTLGDAGVNLMIHGHTHRPKIHTLEVNAQPATRIVLGDWDKLGWYLKVDPQGYDLISFEIN